MKENLKVILKVKMSFPILSCCRNYSSRLLCDIKKPKFSQRHFLASNVKHYSDSVVVTTETSSNLEKPKLQKKGEKAERLRLFENEGSKFIVDSGNKYIQRKFDSKNFI